MPRKSAGEQAIVQTLSLLAVSPPLTQEEISDSLGISRETVSRNLNKLETLALVERIMADPSDKRLRLWEPSLAGLILVYVWLVNENIIHPDIEKIACSHHDKWIVFAEYKFLQEKSVILYLINHNVRSYYPYFLWSTPETFVKTIDEYLEVSGTLKSQPPETLRLIFGEFHENTSPLLNNNYTLQVLGLQLFAESIIYGKWTLYLMNYLMTNPRIKEFIGLQLEIEDHRHQLLQFYRDLHFKEGTNNN